MEYNWEPKPGAEEKIYAKIEDLALTLRSSDYLDLPDTIVEDIEVTLPDEAMKTYKKLEKELLVVLDRREVVAVNAAVLVNKLLQVCGGTVYDENRGVVKIHDAKIDALVKIYRANKKEPLLVATNYVHERERVCQVLGPNAVDAAKFKGDIEKEWNSGRIKVLVADPRSLGHGLNLQAGGRTIVWFSPTWSRESYDQFNARLARKGQEKQPLIYRLIASGTMDDAVIESLREKGEGQSDMLRVLTNFRLMKNTK
jgi:SNF2 family DNA or RNA helicase